MRKLTDKVLESLSGEFDQLYAASGRPSIAPEYILRALLLQVFYSVRSERLLISLQQAASRLCRQQLCEKLEIDRSPQVSLGDSSALFNTSPTIKSG